MDENTQTVDEKIDEFSRTVGNLTEVSVGLALTLSYAIYNFVKAAVDDKIECLRQAATREE